MNAVSIAVSILALTQQPGLPLSPAQTDRFGRGEAVQVLEPLTTVWPRSIVYQFIEATPEECAAVLTDYELQSTYIPRIKVSRVLRRSELDADVEYVIDIPLYPDERSVSRQRVVVSAGEYRVIWKTVADSQAKGSITTGIATFKPMVNPRTSRPGTLMIYDQYVVPNSAFAKVPFVRKKAIEASRDAASAIRGQIEREVTSDRARLNGQLARLRSMKP